MSHTIGHGMPCPYEGHGRAARATKAGEFMRTKKRAAPGGFTIVELLTVISIIVLLLAMIIPGINYMKRIARELKVRAQIKGLCEGAEAFYGDSEFYPPSNRTGAGTAVNPYTCGAQKLAAAMVGVDLHGYDSQGDFDLVKCEANSKAYAVDGVGTPPATAADVQRSHDRRKEMYITPTPEMVAVDLEPLYGVGNTGNLYPGGGDPATTKKMGPVLCDAMKVADVPGQNNTTLRAGTQFLYFKANQDTRAYGESDGTYKNTGYIYNYLDNKDLLNLMPLSGAMDKDNNLLPHAWSPMSEDDAAVNANRRKAFYQAIINPAITTEARPYNVNTYIIISAGVDGVFGTKDDISNCGK
jgi:type II secretory pathway pseudopilin PulG